MSVSGQSNMPPSPHEPNSSSGHTNSPLTGAPQLPPKAAAFNANSYNVSGGAPVMIGACTGMQPHCRKKPRFSDDTRQTRDVLQPHRQPEQPVPREPPQPQQGIVLCNDDVKRILSRQMMHYLLDLKNRPQDNSISYWRNFVDKYYLPYAKERWCLSSYNIAPDGDFPTATDSWHCCFCGLNSGKRFEATYEVLPRLFQVKFGSGVISEELNLGPVNSAWRLSNGLAIVYHKAVQLTCYEHFRVARKGKLLVIFSPDLKIVTTLSCAHHEVLVPSESMKQEVNQLLQIGQKYQAAVCRSESAGLSPQELHSACHLFSTASHYFAKRLELDQLSELGFSKRHARCLQIAEVVNSMKDLMDFSCRHKMGPKDSLKHYRANKPEVQRQAARTRGLPTEHITLSKAPAGGIHPGMNNNTNHCSPRTVLSGITQISAMHPNNCTNAAGSSTGTAQSHAVHNNLQLPQQHLQPGDIAADESFSLSAVEEWLQEQMDNASGAEADRSAMLDTMSVGDGRTGGSVPSNGSNGAMAKVISSTVGLSEHDDDVQNLDDLDVSDYLI